MDGDLVTDYMRHPENIGGLPINVPRHPSLNGWLLLSSAQMQSWSLG